MPRIAILGARGFLGAPIAEAFFANGWEVIEFNRSASGNPCRQEFNTDIFDELTLKSALKNSNPNVVLSTAWDTEHGKFWTNAANIAYRDATLKFAEICFQEGVESFIGMGTMSEYGMSPGFCNSELSSLTPTDIYSKSKIETGLRLDEIGVKYGKRTHWTRIFQAFGPNEKPERFVPDLIAKLRNSEKFSIRTPSYEMDWIHTTDVASAIVYTLENDLNHFVDIGTGIGTSVREISELICKEFDFDASLLDFSEQTPGHKKKVVVGQDSQLLSLGWKPAVSLRERIRSLR
jgi:nucleoside-diphosphate-sugar epimerase